MYYSFISNGDIELYQLQKRGQQAIRTQNNAKADHSAR